MSLGEQQGPVIANTGPLIALSQVGLYARVIFGLRVIGTAGILVEAKRQGLICEVGPVLQKLREAGYWLSERVIQATLREAGEA